MALKKKNERNNLSTMFPLETLKSKIDVDFHTFPPIFPFNYFPKLQALEKTTKWLEGPKTNTS